MTRRRHLKICLPRGESNQFTDQTQRANDNLLYKIMGDVEDFPCQERQFLSQLQEQDRIPLHMADNQYNKKDAKKWVSEVGENKIEEIQNALLMAWEKFDHIQNATEIMYEARDFVTPHLCCTQINKKFTICTTFKLLI